MERVRRHLGLTAAEVIVAENNVGAAPISIVECAEKRAKEQGGYDHIFCVFDRDEHESFQRALARISLLAHRSRNALPVRATTSVPCFEIFVLLHFEQTDAPFKSCAHVIDRVRQHAPGYQKSNERTAAELMNRLEQALANAHWLAARETGGNPETSLHLLVEHMKSVGAAIAGN